MLETIASVQAPLIGTVLLWSASVKLFTRRGRIRSQTTALDKLLGTDRAALAYRGLGGLEALLGLALLTPPLWWPKPAAVIAMAVGFTGYLLYARIHAPESSCGCMSAKHVPISWRGFSRAGWLLATGVLGLFAGQYWISAIGESPLTPALVMVAEAALFVGLSPEFDSAWLIPLRRMRVRLTKPLGAEHSGIPLDAILTRLHHSDLYRHVGPLLRSDVQEHWDEDEYRLIAYGASHQGVNATAVFAVPMYEDNSDPIRVAVVNEETGETLLHLDRVPEESERPEWALPHVSATAQ